MALDNNIHQPVRFTKDLNYREIIRNGRSDNDFKLYAPLNYVLPFQIKKQASLFTVDAITYVSVDGGSDIDILARLAANELHIVKLTGSDQIIHLGQTALTSAVPEGRYYIKLEIGGEFWYSKTITCRDFTPNLIGSSCVKTKIEYWSTCDIGGIYYRPIPGFESVQYKNIIYLDSEIGRPDYLFDEEGEEDSLKVFHPEIQTVEKQHSIEAILPEFMLDAISLLFLHINRTGAVEILTNEGVVGEVKKLLISKPEWTTETALDAKAELQFITKTEYKIGCCSIDDELAQTCIRSAFQVVATISEGSQDYINFRYTDAADFVTKIPLVNGDYVLINNAATQKQYVRKYNAVTQLYDDMGIAFNLGDAVVDMNMFNNNPPGAKIYYYAITSPENNFKNVPTIFLDDGGVQFRVYGATYWDCVVEVYEKNDVGDFILVETGTGSEYNTVGISYDSAINAVGVYIKCIGLDCDLESSDYLPYPAQGGINFDGIEVDFEVA